TTRPATCRHVAARAPEDHADLVGAAAWPVWMHKLVDAQIDSAVESRFGGEEFQLTFDVRRERARHTKGTSGAAEGSRTPNLLITNQALCQLSYSGPLGRLYYGGEPEDLLKGCDPAIQSVQHGFGDGGVGISIQHGGAGEHDLAAGVAPT